MPMFFYEASSIREGAKGVVAVVRQCAGYIPVTGSLSASKLNAGRWSARELESALGASMFGWDKPVALPALDAIKRMDSTR